METTCSGIGEGDQGMGTDLGCKEDKLLVG